MSQDEYFLRAIADEPGDDAARLAYADWLEERGDPRAELIRVEHALGPGPRVDPRRLALADRAEERGNKEMADYIRREDPARRALEERRSLLLAGAGAGWLAVVGKRGPCLRALGRDERVVLGVVSRGCFHHDSWEFVFSGPGSLQAAVTKPALPPDRGARPLGTVRLTDDEVDRLDALLEHYRATTEEGGSTTHIQLDVSWQSGGKKVHQDSFVDRGSRGGERHLPVLWILADRAAVRQ